MTPQPPMGPVVVAVDQGKSGTRAMAWQDGHTVAEHSVQGSRYEFHQHLSPSILAGIVDAIDGLALSSPPDVVAVGTTGAPAPGVESTRSATAIQRATRADRVIITEDVVTAYLGALGERAGVVVSAGTGAVALWTDGLHVRRSDGWGPLLGDEGSGYDIGRTALVAALAAADGRGPATTLQQQARDYLGGLDLTAVQRVHAAQDPVLILSDFVPMVIEAAAAGDEAARSILERAGRALAHTTAAAAHPAIDAGDDVLAAPTGRLFGSTTLTASFRSECAAQSLTFLEPAGDSRSGALLLGRGRYPSAFQGLLTEVGRRSNSAEATQPHPGDR